MSRSISNLVLRNYYDTDFDKVEFLLERLCEKGYVTTADDCTHIVLSNDEIVGAFHANRSNHIKEIVFRLSWLVAKRGTSGIGSYMVDSASNLALQDGFHCLYASYNIKNEESITLFERKYGCTRQGRPGNTGEVDSVMVIREGRSFDSA